MYVPKVSNEGFVSKISYYKGEDKKTNVCWILILWKKFSDIQVEEKLKKSSFSLNKNIIKKWKFSFTWPEV